jgi:threonine/homoserine/homoserine lactone efflux protein
MSLMSFLKGLAVGFSIAAPVGPIGILCIRRSLRDGMSAGFVAGLGAATADAAYGALAAFGLASISGFVLAHRHGLGLTGGAFLCYLGVRTFLSKPHTPSAPANGIRLATVYASALFLTLANPATILSFAVIFAAFGLGASINYHAALLMVLGVFVGSASWWLILSGGVGLAKSRIDSAWIHVVNRASGAVLVAFGILALLRA